MSRHPSSRPTTDSHALRRRSGVHREQLLAGGQRQQEKTLPSLPLGDEPQFTSALCASPTEMDVNSADSYHRAFSPVPLTPRIAPEHSPTRLPTPDFIEPKIRHTASKSTSATLRTPSTDSYSPKKSKPVSRTASLLSRGASFISFRAPMPISLPFTHTRSHLNSDTKRLQSLRSANSSVDSGHSNLIPNVGTTNRFTNRWPIPRIARKKTNGTGFNSFDDGTGLGMDNVRQWPGKKWSLLLSVLSVLSYGIVAMMYGLATWFRSGFSHSISCAFDGSLSY